MNLYDRIKKYFPIDDITKDLRHYTDNPHELDDFLVGIKVPLFIMTYNRKRERIIVDEPFRNICEIVFVCSTDDPYLEEFRKELKDGDSLLVFDKKDYLGDDERNGDNFGLMPPYNQCGCFARRFINDYIRKNNIRYYIVSDNDIKISIRDYTGKRKKSDEKLVLSGIKLMFYILDKYDEYLSFINPTHPGQEKFGTVFNRGWDVNGFLFYFHNKPIYWVSRYSDDFISSYLHLKDHHQMDISLPYFSRSNISKIYDGDSKKVYQKYMKSVGDDEEITMDKMKKLSERYANKFLPGCYTASKRNNFTHQMMTYTFSEWEKIRELSEDNNT